MAARHTHRACSSVTQRGLQLPGIRSVAERPCFCRAQRGVGAARPVPFGQCGTKLRSSGIALSLLIGTARPEPLAVHSVSFSSLATRGTRPRRLSCHRPCRGHHEAISVAALQPLSAFLCTKMCGLTIRSNGAPTARRQARSTSVAYPAFRGPAVVLSSPA